MTCPERGRRSTRHPSDLPMINSTSMRHARSGVVLAAAAAAMLCADCARSSLGGPIGGEGDDGGAMDGSGDGSASSDSSGDGSSSSSGGGGSGSGSGNNVCPPVSHRSSDLECTQPAVRTGNCNFYGTPQPGQCFVDSDCADAGVNGRCIRSPGSCVCTFDACSGDSTCAAGQTCACHTTADTGDRGNTCVPGNCRVDSDCGPGGLCSPTPSACGGVGGYYCHTPQDDCTTDCACVMVDPTKSCAFDPADGRWTCQARPSCQ